MSGTDTAVRAAGISAAQAEWYGETGETLARDLDRQLPGATGAVRLSLLALLAAGPLWLEDAPGTGKTTLARALAGTVRGVTPVSAPGGDPETEVLLLEHPGVPGGPAPSVLLAAVDPAPGGRAVPLLTVLTGESDPDDGGSCLSPQVRDRVLVRASMGRPDHASTLRLLADPVLGPRQQRSAPRLSPDALQDMRRLAAGVEVGVALLGHLAHLMEETHRRPELRTGVSPRAGRDLVRALRVHAALAGRPVAIPADVQALLEPVWAHRLRLTPDAEYAGATVPEVLTSVLGAVPAPRGRGRGA